MPTALGMDILRGNSVMFLYYFRTFGLNVAFENLFRPIPFGSKTACKFQSRFGVEFVQIVIFFHIKKIVSCLNKKINILL